MKEENKSEKIFHRARGKTTMVVAIIIVFLMLAIQFTSDISYVTTSSANSNILNQNPQMNGDSQSSLSTYRGHACYVPQLICSFALSNKESYFLHGYSMNKSLYIPTNHNMLVMGYEYTYGDLICNEIIAVLTPQGHEKNIVTFDGICGYPINGSKYNRSMADPYISSAIFDKFNKNIYISVPLFSNVSIFNLTTCNITGSIPVGNDPVNITVDQQTGYIYVINRYSNNLSVINPYTEKVVTSINVGISPDASIYDPYNQYLYVANSGSDSISVINTTYNSVTGTINVGSYPTDMLLDPQNQMIYVNNQKSACISVIETQYNSVEKIINLPEPLFKTNENMVYYEKTGSIYAGEDTANITVINTSRNEISRNIVTENSYYLQVFGNLTIDAYNNSLIETPEYGSCWSAVNLTTNSLGGYMWFKGATSSRLSINNPFSKSEFFISVNGNNVQVYTFNITNSITITPPDLYPLIIFVSIVLLAVTIIWRIKVRRSQYKEYIP